MCASYGLSGSGKRIELPDGLEPMDDRDSQALLSEWMEQQSGNAKITGKNALNLNPIIRANESGKRELLMAWWWLWFSGVGPNKFSSFNSRDDKLLGPWKGAFQHRAILPADWYVEKGGKFHLPDHAPFGVAAVTSTVKRDDGSELVTYSMVTRDSVGEAAEYHPRMPLVLPQDIYREWLDPERAGDESLVSEVQHGSDEISRALTAAT
ncbi:SOS response-associated peptidase [Leucobacter viscericola]|uniref:SOS response-associated peptidase n=1 Tax=Leucobacter viscericola TaxID=2714935 RepID=A0A6G7XHF8_9MICO|nr:SOS response-associated peptidase family protein [Leucobacter viscericola]QIK64040.1 SOS response-associated peptidase [Leucobacter viscericola]